MRWLRRFGQASVVFKKPRILGARNPTHIVCADGSPGCAHSTPLRRESIPLAGLDGDWRQFMAMDTN